MHVLVHMSWCTHVCQTGMYLRHTTIHAWPPFPFKTCHSLPLWWGGWQQSSDQWSPPWWCGSWPSGIHTPAASGMCPPLGPAKVGLVVGSIVSTCSTCRRMGRQRVWLTSHDFRLVCFFKLLLSNWHIVQWRGWSMFLTGQIQVLVNLRNSITFLWWAG